MTTNNPDLLLADLRERLANATRINDLDVRLRCLRIIRDKAVYAVILDVMTVEQRDALQALRDLAVAAIDETALALPPKLSSLEAA